MLPPGPGGVRSIPLHGSGAQSQSSTSRGPENRVGRRVLEQFLNVRFWAILKCPVRWPLGGWQGSRGGWAAGGPWKGRRSGWEACPKGPHARTRRPLLVAAPAFHRGRSMPQKNLGGCGGQSPPAAGPDADRYPGTRSPGGSQVRGVAPDGAALGTDVEEACPSRFPQTALALPLQDQPSRRPEKRTFKNCWNRTFKTCPNRVGRRGSRPSPGSPSGRRPAAESISALVSGFRQDGSGRRSGSGADGHAPLRRRRGPAAGRGLGLATWASFRSQLEEPPKRAIENGRMEPLRACASRFSKQGAEASLAATSGRSGPAE